MKKKIPSTNNLGGVREKATPDLILKKPDYNFRASIIRRFMDNTQFKAFVQNYDRVRGSVRV